MGDESRLVCRCGFLFGEQQFHARSGGEGDYRGYFRH